MPEPNENYTAAVKALLEGFSWNPWFIELGFSACAIDSDTDAKRDEMFAKRGITFTRGNLNDAPPLASFADNSMDVVVLGEVFEHTPSFLRDVKLPLSGLSKTRPFALGYIIEAREPS